MAEGTILQVQMMSFGNLIFNHWSVRPFLVIIRYNLVFASYFDLKPY